MFTRKEKLALMKVLMWDYNISPEHCLEVLEGVRKNAGHYNEKTLFKKLLESYRWFTVLQIFPLERISLLLTKEVVQSFRMQSIRTVYEFARKRLSENKPWLKIAVNLKDNKEKLEQIADDFLFARDNSLGAGKIHIMDSKVLLNII